MLLAFFLTEKLIPIPFHPHHYKALEANLWHNGRVKIFWLFNHPAPYKVDLFNEIGKSAELDVLFERGTEAGRNGVFYSHKPEHFHAEIAHSIHLGGIDNFTLAYRKFLKCGDYDVIVLNGWRTLTEQSAISYCKRHHIPYVFAINGGIAKAGEAPWKAKRKTRFISGANAYLAPDARSAQYLIHYGADETKILLYPYSSVSEGDLVPHAFSQDEKEALRKDLGIQGKRVFISSGQFIERKNVAELLSYWPSMDKDDTLLLTGDGPQKAVLEQQAKDLGLTNVTFLPYLPHADLFRYFRAADAFITLSKEDIYGHVINEALSQGLPVIASKNMNAALHLIRDGFNGYVVTLGDKNGILGALNSSFEGMGENALQTAKSNTIERSAQEHLKFFSALMEAGK